MVALFTIGRPSPSQGDEKGEGIISLPLTVCKVCPLSAARHDKCNSQASSTRLTPHPHPQHTAPKCKQNTLLSTLGALTAIRGGAPRNMAPLDVNLWLTLRMAAQSQPVDALTVKTQFYTCSTFYITLININTHSYTYSILSMIFRAIHPMCHLASAANKG